ncbi:uncharacterized protein [Leptinotarsa decemlineata]|uniref:uncharacterized protein n=1 Tax=Leptinotarsa decemlineata TaxID=7539 RepID=UPI003D309A97
MFFDQIQSDRESKIAKSIKQKVKDNEVIFTRADKGRTVIALNKKDYIGKTLDFLNSGSYEILRNDPTTMYQKKVKETLKTIELVMNGKDKCRALIMNPQPPKLYSLIKLHKTNFPIRPVVSFVTAPTVKISEILIKLIQTYTNFKPKFSINNSYQLVDNIKDVILPDNSKLISFDVQNLFPSIPPTETIGLVECLLDKNHVNPLIKQEIVVITVIR